MKSTFVVEIWSRAGVQLAEFSTRARNRRLTKSRNEADDIAWSIDLNEYERYQATAGYGSSNLIVPGQTEVRIRRGETYLGGGVITYMNPHISASSAVIDIKATGFLDLFADRYTDDVVYTALEATTIATNLINGTQGKGTLWDFGVTIGPQATVGPHDRTYKQDATVIKDALQNLTQVQVNPFDMEFTADKVFKTYAQIGSVRADVIFELSRSGGNIKSLAAPIDATRIANYVTAYGQGFGEDAGLSLTEEDINSELNYKVRQKQVQSNATDNSDGSLQDHTAIELAKWAFPFQVPAIVVDGNAANGPTITDFGIGDYVTIQIRDYAVFSNINGLYRVEKFDLAVDDNDNEEITLQVAA